MARDIDRIICQYTGKKDEFLAFLSGWIGAAGLRDGLESDECTEIADSIDAILAESFSRQAENRNTMSHDVLAHKTNGE